MRRRRRVCSSNEVLAIGFGALVVLAPWAAPCALAQDAAETSAGSEPGPAAPTAVVTSEDPPTTAASPLRVAVVLSGDPNDEARRLAEAVERAVGAELALPTDAGLRASLLGSTGPDTIAPVVRDRRALGGSEAEDVPLLASLGDRADVRLLLVTRRRAGTRELVVFDVAHRAFFEGTLALDASADDARILRFVRARARAAEGTLAAPANSLPTITEPETATRIGRSIVPRPGDRDEPDWIELNWPYLLAGALLAGAAAFVIVYTVEDQAGTTPTLRFRPGGAP